MAHFKEGLGEQVAHLARGGVGEHAHVVDGLARASCGDDDPAHGAVYEPTAPCASRAVRREAPMRFDDATRTLSLSVRDLVEEGGRTGHLTLETVRADVDRLEAGRDAHVVLQAQRSAEDAAYRPEVRVRHQLAVGDWTVELQGRVDGLTSEDGRTVVEEIKTTLLDAGRLMGTTLVHWGAYVEQLELYLWMLAEARHPDPFGRLVFVSLVDGSHHVLGVPLDGARVAAQARGRLVELVEARNRRIAWMAKRRQTRVTWPYDAWRTGQREMAEAVSWGLDAGHPVLVEAPTGAGKTAAVLHGVLQHALARDKQVFWATARTTQQEPVVAAVARLAQHGLRGLQITAKEKACLNDVVACRPEICAFAHGYHDKLRATGLVPALGEAAGVWRREGIRDQGRTVEVCPYQLALDVMPSRDVAIGDYSYVFDPSVRMRSQFDDTAGDWVVVIDEAHQLVDRARAFASPRLEAAMARAAADRLEAAGARYEGVADLAMAVADRVGALAGRSRDEREMQLASDALSDLAEAVAASMMPYGLARAEAPAFAPGERDGWLEVARQVIRLHEALVEGIGEHRVALGRGGPSATLRLVCLDPAPVLAPVMRRLGGVVLASATLRPANFFSESLGLQGVDEVRAPSPFAPDALRVLVAARISTAFKDRQAHAPRTAQVLSEFVAAVDGNVALYFSSFEMLDDLVGRIQLTDRAWVVQTPGMTEPQRDAWIARLTSGERVVAAAVLGGLFAEGIDLPFGALAAIAVVGPALPPVSLERDLLRRYYEQRYGDGFRYASLVPGLTRVVQAAGRLVRRESDRGTVLLVDRRFRWPEVQSLLPDTWQLEVVDDPAVALRGTA